LSALHRAAIERPEAQPSHRSACEGRSKRQPDFVNRRPRTYRMTGHPRVTANTLDMWYRDTQPASAISSSVSSRPKWLSINHSARLTGVAVTASIFSLISTKPR
jgi:hypothetical protein